MALAHRVNTNYSSLLSTFYCKCMINVRFKTEQSLKVSKSNLDMTTPKNFKTFEQMVSLRQNEAKKSILVKLNSFNHIPELTNFTSRFAKIINAFPYSTWNDQNFLLMELESERQVNYFREMATYKLSSGSAHSVTPLFLYHFQDEPSPSSKASQLNMHVYPYSDFKIPTRDEIKKKLQLLKSVSLQMITLHNMLQFTELNIRLRFYTAEQISYYLSRLFTNLCVVPFGSSVNGFGQIGCDLDLLCKTYVNKHTHNHNKGKRFLYCAQPLYFTDRIEQKEFLEMISTILKMCIPGISGIKKILEARVPIIKFFNLNTNMHCDLSSTNMVALHMSELLYIYGELDWRVKPLVCTIRKWARSSQVTRENPGHWITNFSLTLLIIFYLQIKNVLPSLNIMKFYADHGNASTQNLPWYLKSKKNIKYNTDESLHSLLNGFFEYYSTFDFKMQAICIREAKIKQKKDNSPLFIYNPFDPMLNVSKNITLVEMTRIIDQFRHALQILIDSKEHERILNLIEPKQLNITYRTHSIKQNSDVCSNEEKQQIIDELFTNKTDTNDSNEVKESIMK